MSVSRRGFILSLAALPAVLAVGYVGRWQDLFPEAVRETSYDDLWPVLEQAALIEIRAATPQRQKSARAALSEILEQEIQLSGYLTPTNDQAYFLSRKPLHCTSCYAGKPGSLLLAEARLALPDNTKLRRNVLGRLARIAGQPGSPVFYKLQNVRLA